MIFLAAVKDACHVRGLGAADRPSIALKGVWCEGRGGWKAEGKQGAQAPDVS